MRVEPASAPLNVAQALNQARQHGLDRVDSHLLLSRVLGQNREWLIAHDDAVLTPQQAQRFADWVARRAGGEPVAYLLGEREFHGLALAVSPAVLIPRPDTEVLVDWALELLAGPLAALSAPRVLDMGTGSGAIALAVKHRCPRAQVSALDASLAALEQARQNGQRLGLDVTWRAGNWWQAVPGERFDLVLSNPPYIRADDPHLAELRHEPLQALTPGQSGLEAVQAILAGAPAHLNSAGWLLIEHGWDQASSVAGLMASSGCLAVSTRQDIENRDRCTGGRWMAR